MRRFKKFLFHSESRPEILKEFLFCVITGRLSLNKQKLLFNIPDMKSEFLNKKDIPDMYASDKKIKEYGIKLL